MEKSNKIKRSELWNEIYNIVEQIPRKNYEGDAADAPSVATELEELFFKKLSLGSVINSCDNCEHCDGINVPWSAPNELWQKVVDNHKVNICPQCFIQMAKNKLNYKAVLIGFKAELVNR